MTSLQPCDMSRGRSETCLVFAVGFTEGTEVDGTTRGRSWLGHAQDTMTTCLREGPRGREPRGATEAVLRERAVGALLAPWHQCLGGESDPTPASAQREGPANALPFGLLQVDQGDLQNLFEKYVPILIDMIAEGVVDGRQGEKLKMIVPQTDLNMVRNGPR